jgi:hypothetical protein
MAAATTAVLAAAAAVGLGGRGGIAEAVLLS